MMLKFLILNIVLISYLGIIYGQTTEHLSQLTNTTTFLSASEAGNSDNMRIMLNYRNQWKTISTPYTINTASFDLPILRGKLGIGGYFYQENLGDNIHKDFSGKLNVAYHLKSKFATKDIISFGMEAGVLQFSNNGTNSLWEEQWNGFNFDENIIAIDQQTFGKNVKSAFDLGTGISWGAVYENRFKVKAGASVKHLNKPVYYNIGEDSKINRKLTIFGSVEIREQKSYSVINSQKPFFTPDFIYSVQGKFKVIQFGSFVSFPIKVKAKYTKNGSNVNFKVGGHLRLKDAIIINTAFRFNNYYVGLSYDYTISKLGNIGSPVSSFELLLKYSFKVLK